ncbi:MAG: winged helix DNA-binding domain-containing protein [Actinomycetota bacterium]|nr:winged helix DNA-binding domain-containing protein [Actinomycetota bacterium]
MEAERTLTKGELNRALLARQLLLERAHVPLPRALEQVAGLQAQYAPSMYIGLWCRLEDFEREELTRALQQRTVVQGTLMRLTIHLVSAGDYRYFAAAIGDARRRLWLRTRSEHLDQEDMEAAALELRPRLAHGPLRRKEMDEIIGKARASGVGLWLDLVRVPPSGTWERRRADLYAAADDWLRATEKTKEEGLEHLVRRYLAGFGPATKGEIADWSGLAVRDVVSVLERLELRHFSDERGQKLLDVPGAPLPDPDTPAPVRFLPVWDATLLVHARRTGILPEEYRPLVFNTRTPHSVNTFLVDGAVAGTWRYEKGEVKMEPFAKLDEATWRALRDEAEGLVALHA